ncbi:MAG: CHASE2 domain-containing protein [Parvularculaceae bacterium]
MAKSGFGANLRWLGALPLLAMVAVMAAIAITTLANADSRAGGARERLFDLYQRLFPAPASASPFHILEIDRESIDRIGPWPWPRSLIGEIVTASAEAGAKGVVYLEGVDRADPLSPETIGDFWLAGARDERLAQELSLLPGTDLTLARAMAETNAAIAIDAASAPRLFARLTLERGDAAAARTISTQSQSQYFGLSAARLGAPLNADLAAAASLTVAALPADGDGAVRTAVLLWAANGALARFRRSKRPGSPSARKRSRSYPTKPPSPPSARRRPRFASAPSRSTCRTLQRRASISRAASTRRKRPHGKRSATCRRSASFREKSSSSDWTDRSGKPSGRRAEICLRRKFTPSSPARSSPALRRSGPDGPVI